MGHRKQRAEGSLPAVVPALAYTIVEAATLVKSSRSRLYQEIRDGRLRTFTNGDRRLVTHPALEDYVALLQREGDETRWRR